MTHQVLGKRLSAWSVCCGFLPTLTLDALLDSVQVASKQTLRFSVAGGFALVCLHVLRLDAQFTHRLLCDLSG